MTTETITNQSGASTMSKKARKEIDPVKTRKALGFTQQEFWTPLGVTQSAGSRYESGRAIPRPVKTLIAIAHGTAADREAALKALAPVKAGA